MKKVFLLFIAFLFLQFTSFAQDGWFEQTSGTINHLNSVYFIDNNNGWVVGDTGTILNTTDRGIYWNIQNGNTEVNLQSVSFINNSEGWVVGDSGVILFTTNGGTDWNPQISNTNNWLSSIVMFPSTTGYILGDNLFLKTTNGGTDWFEVQLLSYACTVAMFFLDENIGWVIGKSDWGYCGNILQKTIDAGENWEELLEQSGSALYFSDNNNGWTLENYDWQGDFGCRLFATTDGGFNWDEQIYSNEYHIYDLYFINNNIGWTVGPLGLILSTTNGGGEWVEQTSGTTNSLTNVYFTNALNGWAIGGNGTILHTTNGGVSFVEENEIDEIPTTYQLSNNFPNPFNPSTKIKYSIPQSSNVLIKVFDVLGNELETLVNEEKPVGTYELTWYAEQLPSGIYFYRLQAGSFIETKKMVLMK